MPTKKKRALRFQLLNKVKAHRMTWMLDVSSQQCNNNIVWFCDSGMPTIPYYVVWYHHCYIFLFDVILPGTTIQSHTTPMIFVVTTTVCKIYALLFFLAPAAVLRFLAPFTNEVSSVKSAAGITSTLSSTSSSVAFRFKAAGDFCSISTRTCARWVWWGEPNGHDKNKCKHRQSQSTETLI